MTCLNLISAQDKQTGSQRGLVSIPSDMFPESVEQKMENFHGFDWKFSRNFKPVSMRRFRLLKSQVLLRVSLYAAHISGERAGSCVWVPLHNWKVFFCVSALIRVESRTAERALCKSACTWMRACVCVRARPTGWNTACVLVVAAVVLCCSNGLLETSSGCFLIMTIIGFVGILAYSYG